MAELAPYRIDVGSSVDTTDLHNNLWHQDGIYLVGGVIVTPPPPGQGTFQRPGSSDSLWYETKQAQMALTGANYGSAGSVGVKPGFRPPQNGFDVDIEYIIQCKTGLPQTELLWTGGFPAAKPGSASVPGNPVRKGAEVVLNIDPTLFIQAAADFNPWYNIGQEVVNSAGGFLLADGVTWQPVNGLYIEPAGSNPVVATQYPQVLMNSRMTLGGRGASSMSAIAGSLRKGELDGGDGSAAITHCCKWTWPMGSYGLKTPGPVGPSGNGYTSPASTADSYWATGYNGGQVWMGSRLVIRDADWAGLDAEMTTTQGHRFLAMCRDYGTYVCEDAASAPAYEIMMIEMSSDAVATSGVNSAGFHNDLALIIPQLWVLVGNKPPT